MKKRFYLLFCLVLSIATGVSAQEADRNAKKIVVFNNLTCTPKDTKVNVKNVLGAIADAVVSNQVTEDQSQYKESVRANLVKGISQARRISMMDGTGMSEADWYVDGSISNISTTTKVEDLKDSKGKAYKKTYYKATVGVTLHVKDAQSNKIIMSPTFNVSDMDMSWIETREGALNGAFGYLASRVRRYFNKQLPLYANIIEGAREKKDKQKEVYIDLGSATKGVSRDIHFGVYTVKTVAGKEARKQLGKLKITEVEGDEISLCKVQSGGKDIKAAIDAGETLLVMSLD